MRSMSKAGPRRSRRLAPEPLDLALAHLVSEGLGRQADVAVRLDSRFGLGEPRFQELRHRPLAWPPEGVDARVDDQARRPVGLAVQHPEPLGLIEEQAHLVGQALGVEPPALDISHPGHP